MKYLGVSCKIPAVFEQEQSEQRGQDRTPEPCDAESMGALIGFTA
jgi:hypothetical protein